MKLSLKSLLIVFCLILTVIFSSCQNNTNNNEINETEAYTEQTNIAPSSQMKDYLLEKGIANSKILSCPDIDSIEAVVYFREPTEEELEISINEELEKCNYFETVTDRKFVEKNDFIYTDYKVYFNGEIVAEAKNEWLKVGAGYYFVDFEEAVVGAEIGVPHKVKIKSPITTDVYNEGDILDYEIIVNTIEKAIIFTTKDKYVWDKYGVDSEEAFLEHCREKEQKYVDVKCYLDAQERIYDEVSRLSTFELDEKEIEAHKNRIFENQKDMAPIYDLSFEDYVSQIKGQTMDEFHETCRKKAEKDIKEYLINSALSDQLDIESEKTRLDEYYSDLTYQIHKYFLDNIMITN